MELTAGIKIHGYTLVDFISNGASAEVWRIKDEYGNEKALKIFSPVQKVDEATLDLLIDEFKLLYRLDHPHILKSEIMGAYLKVPYIIMHYYNSNLASEMNKRSYLAQSASPHFKTWFSEDECVTLMQQIGGGLAYLHQQGIIHQDVKPENILFDNSSAEVQYVLTDFGISTKIKENIARMTLPRNQAYALTPAYAAPEQFNGRQEFKSDVFSLGVILFEMCEGRLPFTRHGYAADSYGNIAKPEFRNPHLSGPFKNIILSALSESPWIRPAAKEFEQFAIRSRGNTITEPEAPSIRTDKITIRQPAVNQSQDSIYLAQDTKEVRESGIAPMPTIRRNNVSYNSGMRDRKMKETILSPVRKSRNKGGILALIIISVILLGAIVFGYIKHSQTKEKEMVAIANDFFENGNIREANKLFATLARKKGKEDYYIRQVQTDRILAEDYDEILRFRNDRAPVRKNGKWGYIDSSGKEIIECKYKEVREFNTKAAPVCLVERKWGLIDLQGREIRPLIYYGIQSVGKDQWVLIQMIDGKRMSENLNL